jgi:predicted SAM-dependent methyltransferase
VATSINSSPGDAKDQSPMQENQAVQLCLSQLATRLYQVAGDITGLGEFALERLVAETGVGVKQRLESILSEVDDLAARFETMRPDFIRQQTAEFGLTPQSSGLKLHIGTGKYEIDSWLNIDIYPGRVPDESFPSGRKLKQFGLDVKWGLPFRDASVSYVFSSHILEHFYYPREALFLLNEIYRVLEPGGVARLVVPDIEQCIMAYVNNDREFYSGRGETWTWWSKRHTRLDDFLDYAGAGVEPTSLLSSHKYGYDFETLQYLLEQAKFTHIERSEYMKSQHPELQIDDHGGVANAMYRGQHYSLFVEATR